MAPYREDDRFTIRIDLSAEFGDEYEGDADGYAWLKDWQARVRPDVVRAVAEALRRDPRFDVVPVNRGASAETEVEFAVRLRAPRHP